VGSNQHLRSAYPSSVTRSARRLCMLGQQLVRSRTWWPWWRRSYCFRGVCSCASVCTWLCVCAI